MGLSAGNGTGKKRDKRIGMTLRTGGTFPVTGYYAYAGHEDGGGRDCFVSPQCATGMLFERGDKVPDLVACTHVVVWRLVSVW